MNQIMFTTVLNIACVGLLLKLPKMQCDYVRQGLLIANAVSATYGIYIHINGRV